MAKRADAERNRERILVAAREAFAEPGAETSMAEIARRARVGMATLYRNFPGRRELLEALYADEVDALCAAAASLGQETAGTRLLAWVRRFFVYFTNKRHIAAELLSHIEPGGELFNGHRRRVLESGYPLLAASQQSGEIRGDLTLEQVLDMVVAIAMIPGSPGYLTPILNAALDGLRLPAEVPRT